MASAVAEVRADVWDRGDDNKLVKRQVVVRADSAGASKGFVKGCRDRNVGFSVVVRKTRRIQDSLARTKSKPRRRSRANPP